MTVVPYTGSAEWTRENLQWLAGLLEGEGYFGLGKLGGSQRPVPVIELMMSDEDVVKRAAEIAGCGWCGVRSKRYGKETHKTMYRWRTTNWKQALPLMWALFPFMHSRRRQRIADVVREWRSSGKHGSRRQAAAA